MKNGTAENETHGKRNNQKRNFKRNDSETCGLNDELNT